jgi:hypothetical protein
MGVMEIVVRKADRVKIAQRFIAVCPFEKMDSVCEADR